MNRKQIFYTVGQIILIEAALLFLPLFVALLYRENALPFLVAIGIALVAGLLLVLGCRGKNRVIYAREGFLIVTLAWLSLSLIGALPFVFGKEIPRFTDAFFETVSGFTTTGASILENVESLSHGMLFWRSFTHWIGGMGVLVLMMAIIGGSDRSIHIIRAEMPGPIVGKLVPRVKDTAKILYLIYLAMTVVEIIFLLAGGMNLFESAVHAFGTAGTGGFGVRADSMASYSPYLQWVIAIFMLLFGINFNLYYLILIRKFKAVFKSGELWTYVAIVVFSVAVITVDILPRYEAFGEALRQASFQVSSIMTTTGFSSTDFNLWPALSKNILLVLMFIGGCAGSTAGGLKVSRVVILFKMIRAELRRLLHPRSVNSVKFEGRTVDPGTRTSVGTYFALYMLLFSGVFLFISLWDPFDFETNFSAVAACFNNVGPGFGGVGPLSSYSAYSGISKVVLSFAMLFGRLEIWPLLLTLSPSVWAKK